jgi:type II secretory pathway pseudopilin PulG
MFGIGPAELLIVALLAGATSPPLGIPPLDAKIERAAPEKCLFYFSSAGMAKPVAGSTNHTEQLLANPEVQAFFSELGSQITDGFRQAGKKNEELAVWTETAMPLAKIALTRPVAFYVEQLEIHAGGPPDIAAALVLHCGDRTDEVQKIVEKIVALATRQGGVDKIDEVEVAGVSLHRLTQEDAQFDWGVHGDYFLLTLGKQTSADLLARLDKSGSPPEWLATLKKQAAIERVGTVAYLNGSGLWGAIEPKITEPKVRDLLKSLGANKLVSVGGVGGLDGEGIVTRQFVDFGGWPAGLEQKPLTAADFKPIPDNVEFASIARFDLGWLYRRVIDAVDQLNPAESIQERIAQAEGQLGFQVEGDLLASLGDVWTAHSNSGGGMLPMSNLVLTVTVRDQEKLTKVHDKLLALAQALLAQQPEPPVTIETKDMRGVTVHHVQPRGPVSWDPAWAVVDGRLVVAATFQGLKAQIARGGKKSLAELPAVADRLKAGPMTLTYQDTRSAVRQLYTLIQTFGPILVNQLAAQGINVELPTLPDLEAIEPHILPRIDTTRRTSNGLESESFSTVPFASMNVGSPATIGVLVALLLPAVQQAREAARRNQAMNQLKEICLAMQNYHGVFKKFPPAAVGDAKDKPLLSWRVKILPYLGEEALYNEFHLDEPWDSEHNKPLLEKMPAVYKDPRFGDRGNRTVYLVPTGEEMVFFNNVGANMKTITDGTSKTILAVEADPEKAVPWTKPDDLKIDPKEPGAGLSNLHGLYLVVAVDGSVHVVPSDIDSQTLWALFTRAGREPDAFPDN